MSFKRNPKFNKLLESNSYNMIKSIYDKYENNSLELNSALELILFTLLKKNIKAELAPKTILFIYNKNEDIIFKNYEDLKEKWIKAGFDYPKIKLWNLKNIKDKFFITNNNDIIKISGYNSDIWPYLLESKEISYSQIILNKFMKQNFEEIII